MIIIENQHFHVNKNEYEEIHHLEYNNLKLYKELGQHQRIVGLILKLSECLDEEKSFLMVDPSHGGYIPVEIAKSNRFKRVEMVAIKPIHSENIYKNTKYIDGIFFPSDIQIRKNQIIFCEHGDVNNECILISKSAIGDNHVYRLKNTPYRIYIHEDRIHEKFKEVFRFYLEDENIVAFNNLVNLCIMVKNAGEGFENILMQNLSCFDRFTILDTGSTDQTIDVIKKVLMTRKDGRLYQEPFINFRDSRNQLLDLAGTDCRFTLMLDDTYVVRGDLYDFLEEVRSDQYAESFAIIIKDQKMNYGSNRVLKTSKKLRYKFTIHEVVEKNINVIIPEHMYIEDIISDYMAKRSAERNKHDLKLLHDELENDRNEPRTYYYLGQTYFNLGNHEKAFFYYNERKKIYNSGFIQERVDAAFLCAMIADHNLKKPWEECEQLYLEAFKIDENRPESLYNIGVHYYYEKNYKKTYEYMKRAYHIGFPSSCQYSLRPEVSFQLLPMTLTEVCYYVEDFALGKEVSEFFFQHNNQQNDMMISWHNIYTLLTADEKKHKPMIPEIPIFCFIADGGYSEWSGSSIEKEGVGGSETFIIEMATSIQKRGEFQVYVFCRTSGEVYKDVIYKSLESLPTFINQYYTHTCVISRFSYYLPLVYNGLSENVFLILHDLLPIGNVIPRNGKLKNIFCLTEWHVDFFRSHYPTLSDLIVPFNYGINDIFYHQDEDKDPYRFIYSSFPNRGLYELLLIWPKILKYEPRCSLHLFCNLDHEWCNKTEPIMMQKIRDLIKKEKNIVNHGWVSKHELAKAWKSSGIWFYPCTFMETFCLTALEAAASKTLAVTNDLGSLVNTVSNRGVVIAGDAKDDNWKKKTLMMIYDYLDDPLKYQSRIEKNYQWALEMTWDKRADYLLDQYVLPLKYEFKNMFNWTTILSDSFYEVFTILNKRLYTKRVLEIGVYTGMSIINILANLSNSEAVVIDSWKNNDEFPFMEEFKVKKSFYKNVQNAGMMDRIQVHNGDSKDVLYKLVQKNELFDFIYIDGSHNEYDFFVDIIFSWKLLQKHGILVIDDVIDVNKPLNYFLNGRDDFKLIIEDTIRVFIEKI